MNNITGEYEELELYEELESEHMTSKECVTSYTIYAFAKLGRLVHILTLSLLYVNIRVIDATAVHLY